MKVTFVITLGEETKRTLYPALYDEVGPTAKAGYKGIYTDDYWERRSRVSGIQYWVDTDLLKHTKGATTFNNSLAIAIKAVS